MARFLIFMAVLVLCAPLQAQAYQEPTIENFSKLYWKLSKLELQNNRAVDNYLFINECDLYRRFVHNDFEWRDLRESTRAMLAEKKNGFSTYFAFVQPVYLGDYDFEREAFTFENGEMLQGMRHFELPALNAGEPVCDQDRPVWGYPPALSLELNRPLSLRVLPMAPDLARQFLESRIQHTPNVPAYRIKEQSQALRKVYLLIKVQVNDYVGEELNPDRISMAKVTGTLEGVELYADEALTQPLHVHELKATHEHQGGLESELRARYRKQLEMQKH